jgi:hypothetical protein
MNIDPDQAICGLRPALLKRIFSRRNFSTGHFERSTKLRRMAVDPKLAELAAEGWIIRAAANGWATTVKGDRLAATSLTAPITVAMARDLLRDVIAAAEAIAANRTGFYVVERLVLFGGRLAGPTDEKVRDLDLGYDSMVREPNLRVVTHGLTDLAAWKPLADWGEIPSRLKAHKKISLVELRGRSARGGLVVYERDRAGGRGKVRLSSSASRWTVSSTCIADISAEPSA